MTVKQRERCVPTDQEILDTAVALAWNLARGPRQLMPHVLLIEHSVATLVAWYGMSENERRQWSAHLDTMPPDIGVEVLAWARGIDGKQRTWAASDSAFRKARLLKSRYQHNPEDN